MWKNLQGWSVLKDVWRAQPLSDSILRNHVLGFMAYSSHIPKRVCHDSSYLAARVVCVVLRVIFNQVKTYERLEAKLWYVYSARIFQSRFSVGILIRNCVDFDQFTNCCIARRGALSEFDRILPKIMHRTGLVGKWNKCLSRLFHRKNFIQSRKRYCQNCWISLKSTQCPFFMDFTIKEF